MNERVNEGVWEGVSDWGCHPVSECVSECLEPSS